MAARSRLPRAATSGRCRQPGATRGCSSRIPPPNRARSFRPTAARSRLSRREPAAATSTCCVSATPRVSRLTFDDGAEVLDGWSRDGRSIYFSSTTRDIAGMNDVFRVPADGGTPMPVTNERYTNEFFSAASPDGARLAFSARGIASGQWWRNGHSHIDESEIWTRSDRRLHARRRSRREGAVADVGRRRPVAVFHVGPRRQREHLAGAAPGRGQGRSRGSTKGRVLWPSITADGKTIAFERDFGLWTLDTASGKTRRADGGTAWRAGHAGRRAPAADQPVHRAGHLARRQEGGDRRARRGVCRVFARRRAMPSG